MELKWIGLIIAVVGAVIVYTARFLVNLFKNAENKQKMMLYIKIFGGLVAVFGSILVFWE